MFTRNQVERGVASAFGRHYFTPLVQEHQWFFFVQLSKTKRISETQRDIIMDKCELAVKLFSNGYQCSQSILSVFGPNYDLDENIAVKLASPFGGGMAMLGGQCGAVTAAYMVLGLKYGSKDADNIVPRHYLFDKIKQFRQIFVEKHGSVICNELLGEDISSEEGLEKLVEQRIFETRCPEFVRTVAELMEEVVTVDSSEEMAERV